VLTLPVSPATTERSFSAMNIVKTRLRNKIEDEFLTDFSMVYIEREVAATISKDSIRWFSGFKNTTGSILIGGLAKI
jgi:hypothetical protein